LYIRCINVFCARLYALYDIHFIIHNAINYTPAVYNKIIYAYSFDWCLMHTTKNRLRWQLMLFIYIIASVLGRVWSSWDKSWISTSILTNKSRCDWGDECVITELSVITDGRPPHLAQYEDRLFTIQKQGTNCPQNVWW
jgi:hypothetical protein